MPVRPLGKKNDVDRIRKTVERLLHEQPDRPADRVRETAVERPLREQVGLDALTDVLDDIISDLQATSEGPLFDRADELVSRFWDQMADVNRTEAANVRRRIAAAKDRIGEAVDVLELANDSVFEIQGRT